VLSCVLVVLASGVACGPGIPVPLPVPPTPTTPQGSGAVPTPPSEVVEASEVGGFCGHHAVDNVTRFRGHHNASDGAHYHGWEGPGGERFWVRC